MAKQAKRKAKKPVAVPVFDLRTVNPHGRVDVLAARTIEHFAVARVPELLPLLEQNREVIHAQLNEALGPHAIDLAEIMTKVQPFMPLIGAGFEYLKSKVHPLNPSERVA